MFEDSLVESTGRIRTRSRWFAVGSFALQAVLLAVMILLPYLYPAALPQDAISTLLVAPPPPAAPAQAPHTSPVRVAPSIQNVALTAPPVIPRHVSPGDNTSPTPPGMGEPIGFPSGNVIGAMPPLGPAPAQPRVVRAKPSGPLRVSAGVAEGQLLAPIKPVYPIIARDAHVQGTVIIDAVISTDGTVEQARVVSGSPLLTEAALSAVSRARYQPYRLNGQPVAVETTIRIIFTLGN